MPNLTWKSFTETSDNICIFHDSVTSANPTPEQMRNLLIANMVLKGKTFEAVIKTQEQSKVDKSEQLLGML